MSSTGAGEPVSDINELLTLAQRIEASDIHLKVGRPPIMRVFGELHVQSLYKPLTDDDLDRIVNSITNQAQRQRFEEQLELDLSYDLPGVARFRVNIGRERAHTTIVMRLLSNAIPSLDSLRLPSVCKELIMKPRGLILVTGPTGSGKSTTLASLIDYRNARRADRIITCEDPIEYVFEDKHCLITQRELGEDTPSFASALKHALRQDPDVILVGEMRDPETIQAALTAAETGHLVLSTLHTNSAALTVDRIIDVFPAHQQAQIRTVLSNILVAVLSQTLVPSAGGHGRVAAVEVMIANSAISNLIRESKTHQLNGVIETGARNGMKTLDQALIELYRRGAATLEDILEKANDPERVRGLAQPR